MKPWEVQITAWDGSQGWRWQVDNEHVVGRQVGITVWDEAHRRINTRKTAIAGARRVMKRLGLVEKAKGD